MSMSRIISVSSAVVLLLLPVVALAAPAHKRHVARSARFHGYGFLPGYHQPPNPTVPVYGPVRSSRGRYVPRYYWYDGEWRYFGRPGFYRGQYNGGSFGPCWTITPIGRIWTCG
jgi:hypothetical protein